MSDRVADTFQVEKWETPHIINENVQAPHSTFLEEDTYSLNGEWDFFSASSPENREEDFWKTDFTSEKWDKIPVPSCWETKGYGKPYYFAMGFPKAIHTEEEVIPKIDHNRNYTGQYRYEFTLPEGWEGERLILHFGSVKSAFYCWINGTYVGFAKGSMLPTEFDVTDIVHSGENLVCVEVYQFSDATYLEDQDMWFLSGIYRDVSLIREAQNRIEDIYAWADFSEDFTQALLHVQIKANLTAKKGNIQAILLEGDRICAENEFDINSMEAVSGANGEKTFSIDLKCSEIETWSAENPKLYHIKVVFAEDNLIQSREIEFGFRKIERKGEQLLINGMPLKLRGVNYHSFTPTDGYYVSREVYEQDLITMKRHNINAIRTSHYPQDDYFYHLCNVLGIYVMDECNIESHGVREKNVPGDNPLWTTHVLDRMERMVIRDRNHPCIVIWSLGNESEGGENFYKMRFKTLELDKTRPIHYEPGGDLCISDFVCIGYSSVEREQQFADGIDVPDRTSPTTVNPDLQLTVNTMKFDVYKDHPIVATEYMHSMGNSGSNISGHIKVFEHSPRWCGGFIWDYKDKALLKRQKDGNLAYAYDGDFGVESHNFIFGFNGLTTPEGVPHEQLAEVKTAHQVIEANLLENSLEVEVFNRNSFVNLNSFECVGVLTRDGIVLKETAVELDIAPRQTVIVDFSHCKVETLMTENGEYFLTLSLRLKEEHPWAGKGFEIAGEQWKIYEKKSKEEKATQEIVRFEKLVDDYVAKTNDIMYRIDATSGNLVEVIRKDRNLLYSPLRPSFSRAKTDADLGFMGISMHKDKIKDGWMKHTLGDLVSNAKVKQEQDGSLIVINEYQNGDEMLGTLTRNYRVNVDGSIDVRAELKTVQAPSKFGMQMEVDKSFHNMAWLGKGPHDTYWGREESGKVGLYAKDVLEQDEHMRPQEHGNKRGVRFVTLTDEHGCAIKIESLEEPISVSAWPYTLAELCEANRRSELPQYEKTTLNIDCIQNGLGDSFVKLPPQYAMKAGETYQYKFKLVVEDKKRR